VENETILVQLSRNIIENGIIFLRILNKIENEPTTFSLIAHVTTLNTAWLIHPLIINFFFFASSLHNFFVMTR
jgi:hypothetical protein